MTYTEVLELIRAGYNKAEIEAMMKANPDPTPEPTPNPTPTPEPTPNPVPTPTPEPTPEPAKESETEKLVKALGLKFDSLVSAIQTQNVKTAEQDGSVAMTPDSVIASIINPNGGAI